MGEVILPDEVRQKSTILNFASSSIKRHPLPSWPTWERSEPCKVIIGALGVSKANSIAKVVCVQNYYNLASRWWPACRWTGGGRHRLCALLSTWQLHGCLSQRSRHGLSPASRAQHPSDV